jgi:hypothetical protein
VPIRWDRNQIADLAVGPPGNGSRSLLVLKGHGIAKVLGIVSHAAAVEANELWFGHKLLHLIHLAFGEENTEVSDMIMLCFAFMVAHLSRSLIADINWIYA